MFFAELLTEARLELLDAWRGDIAAYAMIGMGTALLIHSLHKRGKHRPYTHRLSDQHRSERSLKKTFSPSVIFEMQLFPMYITLPRTVITTAQEGVII